MPKQNPRLLLNLDTTGHLERLRTLIEGAERFECVVAFAKMSGLLEIMGPLTAALDNGLHARFTAGLSFCQTEPAVLAALLKLAGRYDGLQLYVGDTPETFHPKIYAFGSGTESTVILGSANLTAGGFRDNYEASAEIDDAGGALMAEITGFVDGLVAQEIVRPATPAMIDEYARKFEISRIHQAVARKKTSLALARTGFDASTLQAVLDVLREDASENGFDAMVRQRQHRRQQANQLLRQLVISPPATKEEFIARYEALIAHFSSGGLQRGKTRIANNYGHFLAALAKVETLRDATPETAYGVLAGYFSDIDRAGVNILTEILMAINRERFANMNKNAVAGMARANITRFPPRPLKSSVSAQVYAEYCIEADRLRTSLGLNDFVELDTLFNHLYWNEDLT